MNQNKPYRMAKRLVFKRRISQTINHLEEEFRYSLLSEGKE
ncbi:MAG: hypothetical protein QXV52_08835 [Nitrososphaeria archaeon]